jgi:hypothetical protein
MKNSFFFHFSRIAVCILIFAASGSNLVQAQQVVDSKIISKLGKQFDVSPDVLGKFKNMKLDDMQNGVEMAQRTIKSGGPSMDESTDKILSARQSGQEWEEIATQFGVDPPSGVRSGIKKPDGKKTKPKLPSKIKKIDKKVN